MKLIGLIGGMSWESTALYYRTLNEMVAARLGGHHSARCLIHSLDFHPLVEAGIRDRWDEVARPVVEAAHQLQAGGAECIVLTANTAHKFADTLCAQLDVPLIHIADAAGQALQRDGITRVGIIGTRYVTQDGFYRNLLRERYGIDAQPPDAQDCEELHRIVLEELTHGRIEARSVRTLQRVADNMRVRNLEGILVACTELPLLLAEAQSIALPCYDTVRLHASAVLDWAGVHSVRY